MKTNPKLELSWQFLYRKKETTVAPTGCECPAYCSTEIVSMKFPRVSSGVFFQLWQNFGNKTVYFPLLKPFENEIILYVTAALQLVSVCFDFYNNRLN